MQRSRSTRPHHNLSGNNNISYNNHNYRDHSASHKTGNHSNLLNNRTTFNTSTNQRKTNDNHPASLNNNNKPKSKSYNTGNHSNYNTGNKSYNTGNHSNYNTSNKSYNTGNHSNYNTGNKSYNTGNHSNYNTDNKLYNNRNRSNYNTGRKLYNNTGNQSNFNNTGNKTNSKVNKNQNYKPDYTKYRSTRNNELNDSINSRNNSQKRGNNTNSTYSHKSISNIRSNDPKHSSNTDIKNSTYKNNNNNNNNVNKKTSESELPNSKSQPNKHLSNSLTSTSGRGKNKDIKMSQRNYSVRNTNSTRKPKPSTNNSSIILSSSNTKRTTGSRSISSNPKKIDTQTQDGRKEIAKQTLDIIKLGQYSTSNGTVDIKKDIDYCVRETKTINPKHYTKDWKPQKKQPGNMCQFDVLPESSFGAARKLVKDNKKTCVLNFASATKPGGGFINGKQAQEESLSRQSALYKSLEGQKEMYEKHKKINDNYYTDYMIYSPEVPVFRNDTDETLLPESFKASVITSAAPNKTKIDQEKYSPYSTKKKKELSTLIKDRCRKIVQCAIDKENDALVLGAYGCGVFGNDPKEVSKAFKEVLVDEGYGRYFDKVVFAIPGQHSNNFRVFSSVFQQS